MDFDRKQSLRALIEESIQVELNTAKLYWIFNRSYPEDSSLWWVLSEEEKNHASILRSGLEIFLPAGIFPEELVCPSLEEIHNANERLVGLIQKYEIAPPARQETFQIALDIEQAVGEAHFQQFMEKEPVTSVIRIFQRLNQEEKDHAERIRTYRQKQN